MTETDLELAQLLCTRLCHDLAGPIGAVAAGVELIGGDPGAADAETLGLIGASSAAASFKLKFIRAVLGAPNAAVDMAGLLDGYLSAISGAEAKPKVTWPSAAAIDALGAAAGAHNWRQCLLNLCLAALEMQPGSKEMIVTATPSELRIEAKSAAGKGLARAEHLIAAFTGATPVAELSAKTIQAFVAGRMLRGAGGAGAVAQGPGVTTITASF